MSKITNSEFKLLEKQIKSPVKDKVDWCKAWKKLCCASVPTSPKINEQGEFKIFLLKPKIMKV